MSLKTHIVIALEHIILLLSAAKSLFDSVLYHSFRSQPHILDVSWELDAHSRIGAFCVGPTGPCDCAICLCAIEERDETRELGKCRHLFHCVCIERWVGSGHWTCPICRGHIKVSSSTREVYEEIVVHGFVDFRMRGGDDADNWWLR